MSCAQALDRISDPRQIRTQFETMGNHVLSLLNCSGISMAIFGNRRQMFGTPKLSDRLQDKAYRWSTIAVGSTLSACCALCHQFQEGRVDHGNLWCFAVCWHQEIHLRSEVCCLSWSFGSPPASSSLLRSPRHLD